MKKTVFIFILIFAFFLVKSVFAQMDTKVEITKQPEPEIIPDEQEELEEEITEAATYQELVGDELQPVAEKDMKQSETVSEEESGEITPTKVEIKDDWIYVNDERYFIKGMGYSGWRPHQLPWQVRPDPELIDNDFRLIKEAGFNTVRTWTPLNTDELALARKYGLMVMQGIFVDPTRDYTSPIYQEYVVTTVKNQVKYYLQEPNTLMFMIANEPPIERVRTSGVENTIKILGLMVDSVRQLDPTKIVTFSNWVQLAFLDHTVLPVIAFNVYMFEPHIVSHALTYKGYIEWLKNKHAKYKPLVITEYGMSVSAYGPGSMGRGGNTEEEQRDGVLWMYDDLINAGATGGCVFEWNDEWWKNYDYSGDQNKHETSDPEEWFGIIEIKDDMSELKGRPRLVYDALKKFNQALLINPKNIEFYKGEIPIEVCTTENVAKVFFRINKGAWTKLAHISPHWWTYMWDSSKTNNGKQTLEVKALNEAEEILCNKERIIWVNNQPGFRPPMLNVDVSTDKQKYIITEQMEKLILTVTVTDMDGKPVVAQPVDYAFYESRFWQSLHGTRNTDEKGQIEVEYYVNEGGFINIGAGTLLVVGEYSRKFGDVIAVEVEKREVTKPPIGETPQIRQPGAPGDIK